MGPSLSLDPPQPYQESPAPIEGATVNQFERVLGLLDQLQSVADCLVLGGRPHARELFHLERALREGVDGLMTRNPITGLPDKGAFARALRRILQAAQRESYPVGLIFLDADGLGLFNGKFGHGGSNRLLQRVAAMMLRSVRESDFVAHLFGDEFAILLPRRDSQDAEGVAERIRGELEADETLGCRATVSCGIAMYPEEAGLADALQELADARLFVAKGLGGNAVIGC